MLHNTPSTLLTYEAAARHLGVSPRLVQRLVSTRAIASVKIGRCVRITPEALASYIASQTQGGAL